MERSYSSAPLAVEAAAAVTAAPLSAVSWGAVLAGAAGAASLSLVLAFLGVGLGMSSISPWAGSGASAEALGVGSILWITLTQIAAAAVGGYLAGRLRTRWRSTHGDEVFFRDTAHGFLAWSVATLATAALFVSAIGGIAGAGLKAGGAALGGAAGAMGGAATAMAADATNGTDPTRDYLLDTLFRPGAAAPAAVPMDGSTAAAPDSGAMRRNGEAARIFANAARNGALSAEDTRHLGQLIAERTGLSAAEGEQRVRDAYAAWEKTKASAKEAADKARKAAAYAALWLFIALLGGAFFASYFATWGGRRRDVVD
ncbi:hypothetical protein [Tahibacter harae]|uniref:Transmembrane protein n=1 Tax=Tahibacter harae TaxID=2963937 RepID=A0ABT1QTD6_9GAMM|nr:hypothetical protein [Tahibacter harae]MCQ4165531.1 hypothetical protein [Tahibacter harae]